MLLKSSIYLLFPLFVNLFPHHLCWAVRPSPPPPSHFYHLRSHPLHLSFFFLLLFLHIFILHCILYFYNYCHHHWHPLPTHHWRSSMLSPSLHITIELPPPPPLFLFFSYSFYSSLLNVKKTSLDWVGNLSPNMVTIYQWNEAVINYDDEVSIKKFIDNKKYNLSYLIFP